MFSLLSEARPFVAQMNVVVRHVHSFCLWRASGLFWNFQHTGIIVIDTSCWMSTAFPKYYCHTCKAEITPVTTQEELTCPTCNSEFVEEIDADDPPTRPPAPPNPLGPNPPPTQNQPHVHIQPPLPIPFPFGPMMTDLLQPAQSWRIFNQQLRNMQNTSNNNPNFGSFSMPFGNIMFKYVMSKYSSKICFSL